MPVELKTISDCETDEEVHALCEAQTKRILELEAALHAIRLSERDRTSRDSEKVDAMVRIATATLALTPKEPEHG